jgi:hypothetical protein
VVVDFCRPATRDRLERMLASAACDARPHHIVHFDGHGTFLPNSQIGGRVAALFYSLRGSARGRADPVAGAGGRRRRRR